MANNGNIVGIFDHGGWAVFVTGTREGAVLDRRRVDLVDEGLPRLPHHSEGQRLPIEEAVALVERVRVSAERCAARALEAVAVTVPGVRGIALRACQPLPPAIAERITDYRAQNVADWVMYRRGLASAAKARSWPVHWYDTRTVVAAAQSAWGLENLETHLVALRKTLGPPWDKDHRLALAAAIAASSAL